MLATMTRFYDNSFDGMDRCNRSWPPQYHYYDDRPNPMQFSYAEGRSIRTAPHGRPDRLLPEAPEQDQPNNNQTRRRIAVAVSI